MCCVWLHSVTGMLKRAETLQPQQQGFYYCEDGGSLSEGPWQRSVRPGMGSD